MSEPIQMDIENLEEQDLTLDKLIGTWKIFQLKKGHRFSVDDQMTSVIAAELVPEASTILDIGAGIGSVGLMTLYKLPTHSKLTMIEAQNISHQLAKKTISYNNIEHRIRPLFGDLRDTTQLNGEKFPLITGSPPYIPLGKGVASPHPQRAACRMELRGSIFDYAKTAARHLADDGIFVVCFAGTDPRGEESIREAGLHLTLRQDIVFRADLPPTITILAAQKQPVLNVDIRVPIVIRDSEGKWTEDFWRIRKSMEIDSDKKN
jgi:tRNA1Val (adenine37-N6)-methyltransferase